MTILNTVHFWLSINLNCAFVNKMHWTNIKCCNRMEENENTRIVPDRRIARLQIGRAWCCAICGFTSPPTGKWASIPVSDLKIKVLQFHFLTIFSRRLQSEKVQRDDLSAAMRNNLTNKGPGVPSPPRPLSPNPSKENMTERMRWGRPWRKGRRRRRHTRPRAHQRCREGARRRGSGGALELEVEGQIQSEFLIPAWGVAGNTRGSTCVGPDSFQPR
jgi:hypothetical protein